MKKKLLDRVRDKIRFKHYSISTEKTYLFWIKHYIFFHNRRHPLDLGKKEIEDFLTFLAVTKKVSPTTQNQQMRFHEVKGFLENQVFSALLFLYREVLGVDISTWNIQALRAQQRKHISTVLTIDEVKKIILNIKGVYQLMVKFMYGCGLRMSEVQNIRIKDIDFGFDKVYIWDSKSLKDRTIPLPLKIKDELKIQIKKVKELHQKDLEDGFGSVYIPYALERKYPNAKYETKWQYVFPMDKISSDPGSGEQRRHHILDTTLSRNIKSAVLKPQIDKRVTSHIFRHSYATHLLQNGTDIRSIQELLGRKSIETTMIYTHVVKELNKADIKSPLDF